MKRLFAVILVVATSALSCGTDSQSANALSSMFSFVPAEAASDNILWFNNMEKMKELTGVEPDAEAIEFFKWKTEEEFKQREDIFAGWVQSEFSPGRYLEKWSDTFGFDAIDMSREVWARHVESKGSRSPFSVMKGDFDKNNIIGKLDTLGYQLKDYASTAYYAINEDYQVGDMKSSQEALMALSYLNRIMVTEREIIAAPADEIFFSVLDARSGKEDSLGGSLAHTRVAEALGDVLGAALIPPSQLFFENVNAEWGRLHTYDLAGIGYLYGEEEQKVVVALHYSDDSAVDDINELKHRMAEYTITTGDPETPLLSELFVIGEPEAITYESDSILKLELVYKPDTPRILWSVLLEMQSLGFLVINPSE